MGPRWTRGHSEIKMEINVISAGSDSVCLATRVLLWCGGLSVGRLTQTFAAPWAKIPVTAHMTKATNI